MIQGFYTAKTTLVQKQKGLNAITNNLANVNTKGFKRSAATFEDALYYENSQIVAKTFSSENRVGCGTYISKIEKDFSQGDLIETKRDLDIALNGSGFLGLKKDENSTIYYTRGGNFSFAPAQSANMNCIVNDLGYYLVDTRGDMIEVPQSVDHITIDPSGKLTYEGQNRSINLMAVSFPDVTKLEAQDCGMYQSTYLSGEPYQLPNVNIKQGYVENSNVEMANEMVELIKAQRIFQMNSKVVQTLDEMEAQASRLRK